MELKLEELHYFDFVTCSSTGAAANADTTPTIEVFEDAVDTPMDTPVATLRAAKTGDYRVPVTAAAASGYEVNKSYNVIASATIGGVATKARIGNFKVRARGKDDLAFPTTSGRGVAVDANNKVPATVATGDLVDIPAVRAAKIDNADVATSSRLATTGYTAPDNADIAAIKLKTDNLTATPADETLIITATNAIINAIAALNNLSPAGVRTAIGLAAANLDTQLSGVPAAMLAAAAAAPIASNMKKIDDAPVAGAGTTGTPWGPA